MELFRRSMACVVMAVLLGMALVASPAQASTPDAVPTLSETSGSPDTVSAAGSRRIYNEQTRRCLSTNSAGAVWTGRCDVPESEWYMVNPGGCCGDRFNIIWAYANVCLDSDYAGNVYGLGCNGGWFQSWNFLWTTQEFRNTQTGRCLDSDYNGRVYTLPCNGGRYQKWGFIG